MIDEVLAWINQAALNPVLEMVPANDVLLEDFFLNAFRTA